MKLQFSIEINGPKERVWSVLWDDATFRDWAGIIDEGTYIEGILAEGNTIQFISSENGYGVTSLIEKLTPNEYIQFHHGADTKAFGEAERDQEWTGGRESYSLEEKEGLTKLTVLSDVPDELVEMFEDRLPRTLMRIKTLAEQENPMEVLLNEPEADFTESQLPANFDEVFQFHQGMADYEVTPLHALDALAEQLGVKGIYVKDESYRFGLNAFKGLGASYALEEIIKKNPRTEYTFVSCTDGNHGNALAWRAKALGHKAVIFMPKGSEDRRVKAIEAHQAKVIVTDMNYDDTVRHAAAYAEEHHYYLIQDTALPGYTEVPNHIVLGYSTMAREALSQMPDKPTHVFLQAGVGSMAGGVLWYMVNHFKDQLPYVGVMEASSVACIFESVKQGKMVSIGGEPYTLMAGLNCGEANLTTFPLLKARCSSFIKCSDQLTLKGMARANAPVGSDPKFSSGESGAVGLGFIEEVLSNPAYQTVKEQLKLDQDAVVLLFSTEGELKNEQ